MISVHVFGGWSECDRRPHAAVITGLSRQFFNEWLPPVKPWTYMDSSTDRAIATQLLSYGATVFIDGQSQSVPDAASLPSQPFSVTHVKLKGRELKENELQMIAELGELRVLHLAGCRILDNHVRILTQNRNLRLLWLYNNPLGNRSLASIAELPELISLNLNNTAVTEVAALAPLTRLRALHLGYLGLEDDQLAVLRNVEQLETLHLPANPLNDRCVSMLKNLPKLREIHLQGTRIGNQGFLELHESLPDCAILR